MILHPKIIQYLETKGWNIDPSSDGELTLLTPPQDLGFEGNYRLRVLTDSGKLDYERFNANILNIIADIYAVNLDEILSIIVENGEIFSARISDRTSAAGSINLNIFEHWIGNIRKLLFDTASFTIARQPILETIPTEAETYLNQCKFMQTQKGSFVTRIFLPSNYVLRQAGLFEEQVVSNEVNKKLYDVLEFVKEKILTNNQDQDFDNDFFRNNKDFISLNITRTIRNIYANQEIKSTHYSLTTHDGVKKTVEISGMNDQQLSTINAVIKKIEESQQESEISISISNGFVTALQIKDMDYEKNSIKILAMHDRLGPMIIKVRLDELTYLKAIDAHMNKKSAVFKGTVSKIRSANSEYKALNTDKIDFV